MLGGLSSGFRQGVHALNALLSAAAEPLKLSERSNRRGVDVRIRGDDMYSVSTADAFGFSPCRGVWIPTKPAPGLTASFQ